MNKEIQQKLKELYALQKQAIADWDNDKLRDINTQIFNITQMQQKLERERIERERETRIAQSIEKRINAQTKQIQNKKEIEL